MSNVSTMYGMFVGTEIESLDISDWDVSNVTTMYAMFENCYKLKNLNVKWTDTSSLTDVGRMFYFCYQLEELDISTWDLSHVTSGNMGFLYGNPSLKHLNCPINAATGPRVSFSISNLNMLTAESLNSLIGWLGDLTGETTETLTIGSTNLAKLSAGDIAVGTAKNWSIVA